MKSQHGGLKDTNTDATDSIIIHKLSLNLRVFAGNIMHRDYIISEEVVAECFTQGYFQ